MKWKEYILRTYYAVREFHVIWRYCLNFFPWARYTLDRRTVAARTAAAKSLVEDLRVYGIATIDIDELCGTGTLDTILQNERLQDVDRRVRDRKQHREQLFNQKKISETDYYLVDLWEEERVFDPADSFLKLCINNAILEVVNTYMGMYSKMRFWELKTAIYTPRTKGKLQSQAWHTDRGDRAGVKVFLYISDVSKHDGPYTYLRYSHRGSRWENLALRTPPFGLAVPKESIVPEDIQFCVGKRGTLIFADTSGVHSGGYIVNEKRQRTMLTISYTSQASPWPARYKVSQDVQMELLPYAARFAISNKLQREPRLEMPSR